MTGEDRSAVGNPTRIVLTLNVVVLSSVGWWTVANIWWHWPLWVVIPGFLAVPSQGLAAWRGSAGGAA